MKKLVYFLVFVLILLGALLLYVNNDFPEAPDTLYVNGQFLTLDPDLPEAEAMLVRGGKIAAIGGRGEIERQVSGAVVVKDMEGRTIMPGFIDPHTHFVLSMFLSEPHDLSGFKYRSSAEVWDRFREVVQNTPKGEWILCKGIDPVMIDSLEMPSLTLLDALAPDHPVLVFSQSLHSFWANSLAFERVGITSATPDPSSESYYEKDSAGNLTGLIVEQAAIFPIFAMIKTELLSPEASSDISVKVAREYASRGNTTLVSAGLMITDDKPLILMNHLFSRKPTWMGKLGVALGKLPPRSPMPRHFIYLRHDMTHLLPEEGPSGDGFYGIIGVKHWYDGSPYIGSMYLEEPYLDTPFSRSKADISPGHKGKALIEPVAFREFIREYGGKGWQIAVHTQGDAATHETLDAFEEVSKAQDISALRHRLEHCLLLSESEIGRMKNLNISPSFHINHLYYYGDPLREGLLGEDRAAQLLSVGAFAQNGVPFSMHADQPMFPSEPFRLIQTAVERQTRSGNIMGSEYRISLMEAIKAMTIHAAWQIHREKELGSLEAGKYADFIVLDRDPFDTPTAKLQDIQVLETYVSGNIIAKP